MIQRVVYGGFRRTPERSHPRTTPLDFQLSYSDETHFTDELGTLDYLPRLEAGLDVDLSATRDKGLEGQTAAAGGGRWRLLPEMWGKGGNAGDGREAGDEMRCDAICAGIPPAPPGCGRDRRGVGATGLVGLRGRRVELWSN